MMPPCQDTSVNVKHDGSGRHRGKGPGEAAICPLSLKHLGHVLFCAQNAGQRSTKSAEDPLKCPPMAGFQMSTEAKGYYRVVRCWFSMIFPQNRPRHPLRSCYESRFVKSFRKVSRNQRQG